MKHLTKRLLDFENEHLKVYSLITERGEYRIAVTKRRASKGTMIFCTSDKIKWVQMVPNGTFPTKEEYVYCTPSSIIEEEKYNFLVINGTPRHDSRA